MYRAMKMNRTLFLSLFILIVLFFVFRFFLPMLQKKMPQSQKSTQTAVATPLADILFPTKTPDTLPTNTLQIPREKWGEKNDILAQRVFRYFQSQGVVPSTLPKDKVELYQAFMKAWGKPWRTHYLMTSFDKEELQLIWDQVLLVQANTPEELEKQKQKVSETLKKVQPPAELSETTNLSSHFATQQDVNNAIQKGAIVALSTSNIVLPERHYTSRPLATVVDDVDRKLTSHKNVLEISSSVRFLKLQTLLKEKLGYLASKISYHTKGAAIDLKLSEDAKKRFDAYMKEEISGKTPRLDQVSQLYRQGTPLTVMNLVRHGIFDKSHELVQVLAILEETVKEENVEIIDETFFGVRVDKDGNVTEINPVFHLQYTQ